MDIILFSHLTAEIAEIAEREVINSAIALISTLSPPCFGSYKSKIISSHRRWIGFHQFLPEIDEDKKYPDNPVYPV
jgi:hypothetical protein